MTQKEVFGDAQWIGAGEEAVCPIIRDEFIYHQGERAHITILGLANFILLINGKRVHDTYFLPLNSEFEPRNYPAGEVLGARAYPEQFDITGYLNEGNNVIAVLLGNGWYNDGAQRYGKKKVCFRIQFTDGSSSREFVSGTGAKWLPSFVTEAGFGFDLLRESQDLSDFDFSILKAGGCEDGLKNVVPEKPLATEYYFTDCPRDKVVETIVPTLLYRDETGALYDVGKNTTGCPVIEGTGKVVVTFTEQTPDNVLDAETGKVTLDEDYVHNQYFQVNFGEQVQTAIPQYTWFGFRCFHVAGDARVKQVDVVHANVSVNSDFRCDNETLNWFYQAYLNTQLTNMHTGIPSDCPHIERRGYTGDGQLVCRAAMLMLDARSFYDKWIEDISDGQDRLSGHVQYTAPYVRSGGGPGGWGCAIVQLPYQFWKFYGDDSKIKAHYHQMLQYFDYLEAHSENDLVTSDQPGEWCLGEWCTPAPVALPAAFVNNYFYVKSMMQTVEIAEYLGKEEDIPMLEERIDKRKNVMRAAYFNTKDSRFLGDYQGADAFALDIGLGEDATGEHLVEYYKKLGSYDTGIFGTDILTRLLFEMGEADLAFQLMTSETPVGFGEWRKLGHTSLPEYWKNGRSFNHPMFGAVTANLFEHILGIRQTKTSSGYDEVLIAPAKIADLHQVKGHITTRHGQIAVSYRKDNEVIHFQITVPQGIKATFSYGEETCELTCGENEIRLKERGK